MGGDDWTGVGDGSDGLVVGDRGVDVAVSTVGSVAQATTTSSEHRSVIRKSVGFPIPFIYTAERGGCQLERERRRALPVREGPASKCYPPSPLPCHLGAALRALLLVARLSSDVRLTMPTVGADAVSAWSSGERPPHPPGPLTAAAAAASAASTASTTSTHMLTSLK